MKEDDSVMVTVEWLMKTFNLGKVETLETILALKEKNLIRVEYMGERLGETWLRIDVLVDLGIEFK